MRGEWRIPKLRRLETFVTFLTMEGLWNKAGNGVVTLPNQGKAGQMTEIFLYKHMQDRNK